MKPKHRKQLTTEELVAKQMPPWAIVALSMTVGASLMAAGFFAPILIGRLTADHLIPLTAPPEP